MTQHIAMWSCPRSCSTVIARAFEQLPGCLLFDEPFYAPYLRTHGFNHPQRQEILDLEDNIESDYRNVIKNLSGPLPEGFTFSFQKHISKHLLPEFKGDWIYTIDNFFLLRDLTKIFVSYHKIYDDITSNQIQFKTLYDIFKRIKAYKGEVPIVVLADDLLKNPKHNLRFLCSLLKLEFSEEMLTWEPDLKRSNLLSVLAPEYGRAWYGQVSNSQGFIPNQEKPIDVPKKLVPLIEEAKPYYQEMYDQRVIFPEMIQQSFNTD